MSPSKLKGISVHLGLNRVDPAHYAGWDGELTACESDARAMHEIACGLGYDSSLLLLTRRATADALRNAITAAAATLKSGDIFLLTYSGHGGQMPDVDDQESDLLDETWVLYDRQFLDDELRQLWARFTSSVRILVLSDSCHSGTVLALRAYESLLPKAVPADIPSLADDLQAAVLSPPPVTTRVRAAVRVTTVIMPAILRGLAQAGHRPSLAEPADVGGREDVRVALEVATAITPTIVEGLTPAIVERLAEAGARPGAEKAPAVTTVPIRTKSIPIGVQEQTCHHQQNLYRYVQRACRDQATVSASVLLISGCQDNQLSLDGVRNSLFTEQVLKVWDDGAFQGDYPAFHRQLQARMPFYQSPNYDRVGPLNEAFERQRPFTI